MKVVIHLLEKILNGLGNLCSLLMILMILNVFYDVVMRYLFNDVSIAMQELEWHLFAAMFMLGVGYTLKEDGHVRVDIFYEKMSLLTLAVQYCSLCLLLCSFCILVGAIQWMLIAWERAVLILVAYLIDGLSAQLFRYQAYSSYLVFCT
jgi:TRAP-type mannitol/chloroaromatic compound transport system permease small subunit